MLETGCVYIVPLLESLALPPDIEASANPKSSTGRLDVFTRVIADGVGAFDQIPHGYAESGRGADTTGDNARDPIEAAAGNFSDWRKPDRRRRRQALEQRHDIDATRFKNAPWLS